MHSKRSDKLAYIIVGLFGVAIGGMCVMLVTQAVPRMIQRMMAGMMENMRAQMVARGCKPDDI
jgi:O-succinylbenzoate synthase